jgi:hypothetical protein
MRQALGDAAFWVHDRKSIMEARELISASGGILSIEPGFAKSGLAAGPSSSDGFSWCAEAESYIR